MRAGLAGIAVAAVIGGVLGGSALDLAGAAAAVTVPLAALASLRVLDHAADRTQPRAAPPPDDDATAGVEIVPVTPAPAAAGEPAGAAAPASPPRAAPA